MSIQTAFASMKMCFHEICFQVYTPKKIMYTSEKITHANINDNQFEGDCNWPMVWLPDSYSSAILTTN